MRLKRVLELQDKGLSIRKIAVLLGLSERTVKRDLAKAMPFLERRRRHQLSVLSEADWRELLRSCKLELE